MKPIVMIIDPEGREINEFKAEKIEFEQVKTLEEAIKRFETMLVDVLIICNLLNSSELESFIAKIFQIDGKLKILISERKFKANPVLKYIKMGIDDLIKYPIEVSQLEQKILKLEKKRKKSLKDNDFRDCEIVGKSQKIVNIKNLIISAGSSRLLFLGETGVGKTAFVKWANRVLSQSTNEQRAFEHINCANIKRERLVDELFGHVKGAYTGAISEKRGLAELAKNGDLFLDEIGDLDLECQAELLTYLDNYEYKKLGGEKSERSKVRIICATNKNIKKMIQEGSFRSDLYSRISQCVIKIPSLRERRSDIPVLVRWFIKKITGYDKQYSSEINELYKLYPWKEGNIRELQRACEYMCFQARGCSQIELNHIDEKYFSNSKDKNFNYDISTVFDLGFTNFINEFEREILPRVLKTNESIRENAKILKMDRSTLRRKIIRYQIPVRYDPKFIEAE